MQNVRGDTKLLCTFVGAVFAMLGCRGQIGDEGPVRPDRPTPPQPRCQRRAPSPEIRHLTRAQYARAVRDLLGYEGNASATFPPDDSVGGFAVGATTSPLLAEATFESALTVANNVVNAGGAPCGLGEESCTRGFINDLATRAYRRPLTEEERAQLFALYQSGIEDTSQSPSHSEGMIRLIAAVLASPHFYYQLPPRPGTTDARVELNGFEIASRMSFFLWGSVPDAELMSAAASGDLNDSDGRMAQAERMLADMRAREGVGAFFEQWLSLDRLEGIRRDPSVYPEFSPTLAQALAASMRHYVEHIFFDTDGSLEDLLTSRTHFLDEEVVRALDLDSTDRPEGGALLEANRRAGLLTQPGLMALLAKDDQSDPIHRGLFVRRRLLCQELPEPPGDVDVTVPDPGPGATTRERFAAHTSVEGCADCHRLIDPIGFTFENYDALGRWRTMDQGIPVDSTGEIVASEDVDGPVDNAVELSEVLSSSWEVAGCFVRQWWRFAFERMESEPDECELANLRRDFIESGGNMHDLLVSIVGSTSFAERVIPAGEEM